MSRKTAALLGVGLVTPAEVRFVPLKARVRDAEGNPVDEAIIRAYA